MTHGVPDVCQLGTVTGYSRKLFAVGDSHNAALVGAYDTIGADEGWRIDVAGQDGCYLTEAAQKQPSSSEASACRSWRRQVLEIARDGGYDAIVVTHSSHDRPVVVHVGGPRREALTVAGLVAAWRRLPDVPIIAIRDNPVPRHDVIACVSKHRDDAATRCAQPRAAALASRDGQKQAAQQVPRASVVDLTPFYCNHSACPPVIGHVLVYRDYGHITATYAATLRPYLERDLAAILDRP